MSDLGEALIDQLDDSDLDRLAQLLSDRLGRDDGWLDVKSAARYAGCTVPALRHAANRGQVEFEQRLAGGKIFFRRSALDRWRRPSQGVVKHPDGRRRGLS